MPEVIQAPVENDMQQTASAQPVPAGIGSDGASAAVHPVEFPEAPADAPTAAGGHLDILLDMDVPVTVVLGQTQIPVRRLLQLGPGAVLKLEKAVEEPAELFLRDSKFAEADVVVVDNRFAVRITQILKANTTGNVA
jgi:flagellar motor switch protein FliN/FliY